MIDPANPDFGNHPVAPGRPCFAYAPAVDVASPCLTIATPFYNGNAVFHETARSVLGQSLQQWEWVIVNDGSMEVEALRILDHYRDSDPRIRVIDHPVNRGLAAARNTAFREARADIVAQLDGDDLLEPTALEKWRWFLESHPEFAFVKGYGVGFGALEYLWPKGFHDRERFLARNMVDATSAVRRSIHRAVGGYDEEIREGFEDWDFWLRCADAGHWGATVPEYLNWYRRHDDRERRWSSWDEGPRQAAFRRGLRRRYPRLWAGHFPDPRPPADGTPRAGERPFENPLAKRAPRLLLVVPWFSVGGADKFNLDLIRELCRRGWEVTVAATLDGENPWLPAVARLTPDVFVLHHFLQLGDYARFLHYLVVSRRTDVVMVSNSELGYLLAPYLRSHCPDVAFVDYCHMEDEPWKAGGYPRFSVACQEAFDLDIVASRHLKGWMARRGADEDRISVCPIGVDPETFRPDPRARLEKRRELAIGDDTPVILYAARLCEQKQPRVFAATVQRLAERLPDFLALVAGDGPERPWLESFVSSNRLGRHVRLLGAVSNDRVRELMQTCDVFFLPSRWEGIAAAIYEAMACGCPVVSADVGGQAELVTPPCGMLIPPATDEAAQAEQYAAALASLVGDPEARHRFGEAARRRIEEHFRADQMGDRIGTLVGEARRLHRESPRPAPMRSLGRMFAIETIESRRLTRIIAELGRQSGMPEGSAGAVADRWLRGSWRPQVYRAMRKWLRPWYRAALARDVPGLVPLKDRLRRALLS